MAITVLSLPYPFFNRATNKAYLPSILYPNCSPSCDKWRPPSLWTNRLRACELCIPSAWTISVWKEEHLIRWQDPSIPSSLWYSLETWVKLDGILRMLVMRNWIVSLIRAPLSGNVTKQRQKKPLIGAILLVIPVIETPRTLSFLEPILPQYLVSSLGSCSLGQRLDPETSKLQSFR